MTDSAIFQRVILGLRRHAPRQGLRQAVGIAALLQAELRGLFAKDDELCDLGALPFVREFRPLEGGWRAINRGELSSALEISARNAERMFRDAVRTFHRPCEFEIIAGRSMASAVAALSRPSDILAIYEPADPAEHATAEFEALVSAAFRSPASVLLIPARIARESGPVVVLSGAPDDPSIAVASQIAERASERLAVVDLAKLAGSLGVPGSAQTPAARGTLVAAIDRELDQVRERLLILSHGGLDHATASAIASVRRVPVLVVEPRSAEP